VSKILAGVTTSRFAQRHHHHQQQQQQNQTPVIMALLQYTECFIVTGSPVYVHVQRNFQTTIYRMPPLKPMACACIRAIPLTVTFHTAGAAWPQQDLSLPSQVTSGNRTVTFLWDYANTLS
jgi:hypothetical protein